MVHQLTRKAYTDVRWQANMLLINPVFQILKVLYYSIQYIIFLQDSTMTQNYFARKKMRMKEYRIHIYVADKLGTSKLNFHKVWATEIQ